MDVVPINRSINLVDPPKDAVGLTAGVHGDFMKTQVCAPLFNPGGATVPDDVARAPGVGNSTDVLKRMILTADMLGTMNLNKQQITRLSRNAAGNDDGRLKDMFLAYDCGAAPQDIASSYKVVLTPAAILDRAMRDMDFKDKIVMLRDSSTFSGELLTDLAMNDTIQSIVFNGKVGSNYQFTFKTTIPGYEEKVVEYTSEFKPHSKEAVNCSNDKKNEYIRAHYKDASELSYIKFLVLLKELGDTLLVMWLKQTIEDGEHGLTADKTAITTNDTTVWLRSLVNGVSCILTDEKGANTTLYPVLVSAETIKAANIFIKKQLFELLKEVNTSVVKSIAQSIKLIAAGNIFTDLVIQGELSPTVRMGLIRALKSIYVVVKRRAAEVLTEVKGIQASDMNEYRKVINERTMSSPFSITKNSMRYSKAFQAFLPKGGEKLPLRLSLIQTLCKQGNPNEATLKLILGYDGAEPRGIPLLSQEETDTIEIPQRGGDRPEAGYTKSDFTHILSKNIEIPGFFTSFVMTVAPEIFYMGYAYDLAFGKSSVHEMYSNLLNVEGEKSCFSHLGKLGIDGHTEVDEALLAENTADAREQDTYTRKVCLTLSKASVYGDREGGTLFDIMGDRVTWLLEWCSRNHILGSESIKKLAAEYSNTDHLPTLHWDALSLYQVLYENDVGLCILNKRDQPIDFEGMMKGAVDAMKEAVTSAKKSESAVSMVRAPNRVVVERLRTLKKKRSSSSSSTRKRRDRSQSSSLERSIRSIRTPNRTPNRTKRRRRSTSAI